MTNIIGLLILIAIGYFFGSAREKLHYKSLRQREKNLAHIPVATATWKKTYSGNPKNYQSSELFGGQVVIASDYFKTFTSGLVNITGGRMKTYEALIDRARRESLLRMLEKANQWGAKEIINLRIDTSNINESQGRRGTPSIEVYAYGTALK